MGVVGIPDPYSQDVPAAFVVLSAKFADAAKHDPKEGEKIKENIAQVRHCYVPLRLADAQLGAPSPSTVCGCREGAVQMARWWGSFYRCGTQKSEWENPREYSSLSL